MQIDMFYLEALITIAGMLVFGLIGIYWYSGTEEYHNMTREEKAKFWFG